MQQVAAFFAVGFVALIHLAIGVVEMVFWTRPAVHQRLRPMVDVTEAEARKVAPIVANAGLYNGLLALGLIWTMLPSGTSRLPGDAVLPVRVFFLVWVMIAVAYGARTISPRTLILQSAFAAAALALVLLANTY